MLMQLNPKNTNLTFWPQNSPFQSNFRSGVNPIKLFGINYIRINVIQGKIQLVESIFDVNYAKISSNRIFDLAIFEIEIKGKCDNIKHTKKQDEREGRTCCIFQLAHGCLHTTYIGPNWLFYLFSTFIPHFEAKKERKIRQK